MHRPINSYRVVRPFLPHLPHTYLASVSPVNPTANYPRGAPARSRAAALSSTRFTDAGFVPTALLYEGPWSKVYRVRAGENEGDAAGSFALKLPHGAQPTVAENMLRREASVLRSINHANLIALLDGKFDGQPYLLTPYLEGATLQDVFDSGLHCPPAHALWIARQIAQALSAIHEGGWRHGDVKPDNILVSPSGHATLLDLGLAHRTEGTGAAIIAKAVAGSLTYIAPECLREGVRVDHRADLYSLDIVLYQMNARHTQIVATYGATLANAHLHEASPQLPLADGVAVTDTRHLVARLLAKDPLRRPASASELANRLMRLEIATMHQRLAA